MVINADASRRYSVTTPQGVIDYFRYVAMMSIDMSAGWPAVTGSSPKTLSRMRSCRLSASRKQDSSPKSSRDGS